LQVGVVPAMMTSVQRNIMTVTFSVYQAQKDAQNTIELNIVKYCFLLCDSLRDNYIAYAIDSHENSIYLADAGDSYSVNYHTTCIEKLKDGLCDYDFALDSSGRKYHKIWMWIDGKRSSIHAFIDKKSGEVYKPASIKAPAKGVRYNLFFINDREWLLENADWAGNYLYKR
jgi:hypothetical protein